MMKDSVTQEAETKEPTDVGAKGAAAPTVTARDLFASPIVLCEWADTEALNGRLRDVILDRYRSTPSLVQSARYAWQSTHDFHRWPEPCVAEVTRMIRMAAGRMAAHVNPGLDRSLQEGWHFTSCFANVNPPGGFSQPHDHVNTGGLISGVYYVDFGDCASPAHAGRTVLQDRSGVARPVFPGHNLRSREYAVVPKPGSALLFPAAQRHSVEPYRGQGVRISIAFNMAHPEFGVLYYPDMFSQSWWWRNFRGLMLVKEKVPEKVRAMGLFRSYLFEELRKPSDGASMRRKLTSAFQRAEVDAQSPAGATDTESRLPEKQQLG